MGPFSGIASAFGRDMLNGAQLAADEVNGAGGVGGKRLLLDQGDDKADPAAASAIAHRLLADGVAAVVGPATSGSALAAEADVNAAKIPLMTPTANDPRITDQALPFVFRTAGRWDQEPPLLAGFLLKQPATARVAVVADTSAYGQALAAGVRQALTAAGAPPVADESLDAGSTDFGPVIAKLKAQAPGSVFYGGYAQGATELVKAVRGAGLQVTVAMGDAAEDQALITTAGPASEGLILAYPPDPKQTVSASGLLDGYKRRYGTAPSLYAISTYDTVRLLADALHRTGNADGEALRQALASTTGFGGAYWGKMSFDAKGDLQTKTYALWTVRSGKFEQLS
jgi:branched-chain amino acid transport system substrate-binding protein